MHTLAKFLKGVTFAGALASASFVSAQVPPASDPADVAEILSTEDMDALAGGTGVDILMITDQTLTAVNHGNTVIGDTVGSGDVNLGANAFSGYSGLGNFVINTGHNNNLQSTMSVSVVLAPPPGTP
jgi:hypothetical protein